MRKLVVFSPTVLRHSPFKAMRAMQQASEDFQTYMHQLIASHKSKVESGLEDQEHAGDLLGSIVRGSTGSKSATLSEEEMIGNIFVFVLAGHETTGTTLQTALILLACYPEVQEEVQGEIDGIWRGKREGEELVYEDYGEMRRIMGVMVSFTLKVAINLEILIPSSARNPPSLSPRSHAPQIHGGRHNTPLQRYNYPHPHRHPRFNRHSLHPKESKVLAKSP